MANSNQGMLGINKSNQLCGSYDTLMECAHWWKTLLFHCIDITVVNSYILFTNHCRQHPNIRDFFRQLCYDQRAFWIELLQQHLELGTELISVPMAQKPRSYRAERQRKRCNCKKRYETKKTEHETGVFCKTRNVCLCFSASCNCFAQWHADHEH